MLIAMACHKYNAIGRALFKVKVIGSIFNMELKNLNKKGSNILYENLAYLLFVVVFFSFLFIFVGRAGSGVASYEKIYAKKIALIIDMTNPGSTLVIDVSDMANIALNENVNLEEMINFGQQEVKVKLSLKGGYSQNFFSSAKINANKIEQQGGKYLLKVEVKNE